jgi:hypothetical protein
MPQSSCNKATVCHILEDSLDTHCHIAINLTFDIYTHKSDVLLAK